jgi:hypothetical protein
LAPGATAIIGTTIEIIRHTLPLRNATAIARAMTESKTISDHRAIMPGIYFGKMNDKVKQLLSTAQKVDGISKIKWRIENREYLRKQRKLELKILMKNDQQNSIDFFWNQLPEILPFTVGTETAIKLFQVFEQAKEMYNKEIEESYQDGKEIGTIETLLKNKQL